MTKERKINETLDKYYATMNKLKEEYRDKYNETIKPEEILELNMQITERENEARKQLVVAIVGA